MDYIDSFEFKMSLPLKIFQVSMEGTQFAVGGEEGVVRIYDVSTGRISQTLRDTNGTFAMPSCVCHVDSVVLS